MKILAIETSTMLGGIAIADDSSGLIADVRLNVKSTYSERLMPEIDHVLHNAGLGVSDIDAFGVAVGPGSFTGLRIGLTTAKGLSYATGNPIVAVPTLEAFAWNFSFSKYPVCPLLDARRGEVYAALFQWDKESFIRLIGEVSIRVRNLLEEVSRLPDERIIFTGEGAALYRHEIVAVMSERSVFAPLDKMSPSPANVAHMGIRKALQGEFAEPLSLVPFYLRKSEAEIKWNV